MLTNQELKKIESIPLRSNKCTSKRCSIFIIHSFFYFVDTEEEEREYERDTKQVAILGINLKVRGVGPPTYLSEGIIMTWMDE